MIICRIQTYGRSVRVNLQGRRPMIKHLFLFYGFILNQLQLCWWICSSYLCVVIVISVFLWFWNILLSFKFEALHNDLYWEVISFRRIVFILDGYKILTIILLIPMGICFMCSFHSLLTNYCLSKSTGYTVKDD